MADEERVTVTISTTSAGDDQRDAAAAEPAPRSALHATLGIASSAANLVLYPYVAAGRVAYQATSLAVHAPLALSRRVTHSLRGAQTSDADAAAACDLFGEQAGDAVDQENDERDPQVVVELLPEEYPAIIEADADTTATAAAAAVSAAGSNESASGRSGVVSQLLFLPVRLVSTGVSTAAAIPGSLISYSGRKISGAVSTSQALATTAIVVSSGAVARTSLHVAQGLTHGALSTASFTATKLSGAVGTSVRTVSYAIPTSVSNAVWQGVGATGNASVSVVSYAIAVPAYRMLAALVPDLAQHVSERDCVEKTREGVQLLVKVLGPQNAFYLLKFVYETVNSEEAYDMFLLCHDIARESLDSENYRSAGSSIGEATGVSALAPVVENLFSILPSVEELFDAFVFVADVSGEVLDSLVAPSQTPPPSAKTVDACSSRFEYIEEDGDSTASNSSTSDDEVETDAEISSHSTISNDAFEQLHVTDDESDAQSGEETDEHEAFVEIDEGFGSVFSSSSSSPEQPTAVDAGVAFLAQVCDSDEAASLFNAFGDFLDVLVG